MKFIFFLFLLVAFFGCKDAVKPVEVKTNKFSSINELVIYNLIGDPEYKLSTRPEFSYTEITTYDRIEYRNMNWKELQSTFSINDSIQVTNDLTLVFFTYSIKSNVIRDVEWIRKINDKYFLSSIYLSQYIPVKEFENINEKTLSSLETKIKTWQESSSDVWWKSLFLCRLYCLKLIYIFFIYNFIYFIV